MFLRGVRARVGGHQPALHRRQRPGDEEPLDNAAGSAMGDYDVLEDQGVDLWRDRWGDDALVDEPTTFLPSPRAVLLEQSDEEEPESPVDRAIAAARHDIQERVEARLSPKQSPKQSPPSPQQSPTSASSPQLEEALESARTPSPRGRDTRKRSSKCSYEVAGGNMYTYANANETE